MTETSEPGEPIQPTFAQPIVARPNRAFFVRRMLVAIVVVLGGLWLLYDGFKRYPDRNARVEQLAVERSAAEARRADDATMADISKRQKEAGDKETDTAILIQKALGFPVGLLGIYLAFRFLRENRGELRLADDTLHAPGHLPVPIAAITGVNDQKWDRKGVALFDYRLTDGTTGRVRIDDFVYDRPPTDAIHDELIARMTKA